MTIPEIVGLQEIADLLEVGRRTPHAWQYRRLLPPPDFDSINGLRAWRTTTILQWAVNTGRLPASLRNNPAIPTVSDSDYTMVRGGRRAKAENLAALADAGIITPDESTATAIATNEAAGPGPHARWIENDVPSIGDAVAAIGAQVDESGTVRFGA